MTNARFPFLPGPAAALALGAALLGLVAVLALVAAERRYGGRILPGVSVAGVDVGSMTPEQAAEAIAAVLPGPGAPFLLRDPGHADDPADERAWSVARAELGLAPDSGLLADHAYRVGRRGPALLMALRYRLRGVDLSPEEFFDAQRARSALADLAPVVDLPPEDGDVYLEDGRLVVVEPVYGRQLDVDETVARLAEASARPGVAAVDVATRGTAPRFWDVRSVADAYRVATSGPVRLVWRQGQELRVSAEQLRRWVTVTRAPGADGNLIPAIEFDEPAIARRLEALAADVDRSVRDARLRYDEVSGAVTVLERAASGQRLDVAGSVRRFVQAAYVDARAGELDVEVVPPTVGDDAAAALDGNVTALVRAYSRLEGQPAGRGLNILLACSRLDGVTVPPSAEFSFLRALGTVSADDGFDMIQVDGGGGAELGGGIEQVASGLFRAALWSGLLVTERHAPASRAAWVEVPVGLDAAVTPPGRDLRLVNDTAGHVILVCRIDADRGALATMVVGPPPARQVELIGPIVGELIAPPAPVERVDARLAAGARAQVAWARHGGEVAYQRVVRQDGAEIRRDAFAATYAPSADVTLVGPSR